MRLMAPRRHHKSVVVIVGAARQGEQTARAVAATLGELGVETMLLGREDCPRRIAAVVAAEEADAVELCLARCAGVRLLRELLRELIGLGRREVSIVVHKLD